MELLPYTLKWFEVLLRWSHVLFAILWVGNSFLFNYLDNKLEKNTTSKEVDADGILQHSGWFYRVERLNVAPEKLSKNLNNFSLKGCELYTSCEPCPMCLSAIYWSRVDKIYYANTRDDAKKIDFDDSLIYSELTKKIKERKIPTTQLMRDEALQGFKLWKNTENKVKY